MGPWTRSSKGLGPTKIAPTLELLVRVAPEMLGKLNPAFELEKVAFRKTVAFDQAAMCEPLDFGEESVEVNVHQRRFAKVEVRIRGGLDGEEAGLAKHLKQSALPLGFV